MGPGVLLDASMVCDDGWMDGWMGLMMEWTGTVCVVGTASGDVVWRRKGHQGWVWCIDWPMGSDVIATVGYEDKAVRVWDAADGVGEWAHRSMIECVDRDVGAGAWDG